MCITDAESDDAFSESHDTFSESDDAFANSDHAVSDYDVAFRVTVESVTTSARIAPLLRTAGRSVPAGRVGIQYPYPVRHGHPPSQGSAP